MIEVSIIAGSKSDESIVQKVTEVLEIEKVSFETKILSAHRNPEELDAYIKTSTAQVFICIAGLAAALPGVVAARTQKPVIGVPVSSKLGGLDALLSIVQMPPGVPVACVGIDDGKNAALLAIRMLRMNS